MADGAGFVSDLLFRAVGHIGVVTGILDDRRSGLALSEVVTGEREGDVRVPAYGTAALIYKLTPPRRGRFEFGYTALRFRSRLNLVWRDARGAEPVAVKVYPNMRRAREIELRALGARSFLAIQRRAVRRPRRPAQARGARHRRGSTRRALRSGRRGRSRRAVGSTSSGSLLIARAL